MKCIVLPLAFRQFSYDFYDQKISPTILVQFPTQNLLSNNTSFVECSQLYLPKDNRTVHIAQLRCGTKFKVPEYESAMHDF